jgi:hypothetical protein
MRSEDVGFSNEHRPEKRRRGTAGAMSPQARSVALWIAALAVNVTTACAGILWGWEVFVRLLPPALGSVVGASLVGYSLRR